MKLTPDDPRLSSYLLGELSPEEARLVEQSANEDESVRMALENQRKFHGFLQRTLGSESQSLLPHQRAAVMQASRCENQLTPVAKKGTAAPWLAAAAAVAVAAGTWMFWSDKKAPQVTEQTPSMSPALVASGDEEEVFAERDGEFTNFSVKAGVRLPVHAKNPSLARLEDAVIDKNRLPDPSGLRLQEVANAFVPPMPQVCAVADVQLSGMYLQPAWKNGNRWIGMVLENRGNHEQEVKLELNDAETNDRYRIAATTSSKHPRGAVLGSAKWQKLAAGERTVVWVEHMAASPSQVKVSLRTRDGGQEKAAREWTPKETSFAQAPRSTQRSLMLMGWAMRVHGGEWSTSAPAPEELDKWISSGPAATSATEAAVDHILQKGSTLMEKR